MELELLAIAEHNRRMKGDDTLVKEEEYTTDNEVFEEELRKLDSGEDWEEVK